MRQKNSFKRIGPRITFLVAFACVSGSGTANIGKTSETPGAANNLGVLQNPSNMVDCDIRQAHRISSASSDFDHDDDFRPDNVHDGLVEPDSRWSTYGVGRSIVLDLGSSKSVSGIKTAWYRGDERQAFYDIQISKDRSNWNTVIADGVASGTDGFITDEISPTTARYIRVVGNGNSESSWASLVEVEVLGCSSDPDSGRPPVVPSPAPVANCSRFDNLRITSARSDFDHDKDFEPDNVIDNNLDSDSRWSSFGTGNSIVLELDQLSTVRQISAAWLRGSERQAFFNVKTSADNTNWNTVLTQATASGEGMLEFDLDDSVARYVEIEGLGNSASDWNSIIEVDAFGCGTVDTVTPVTRPTVLPQPTITSPSPQPPVNPNSVFDFSIWDLEGDSPATRDGTLRFDALGQCVVTPNGNGCRHEQKIAKTERYGLTEQYEILEANIEVDMSPGVESIVVQHHPEALGTLVALYISDTDDQYPGVRNGTARDGVFDVYATVRNPNGGSNSVVVFGTIRSGEQFAYSVINDHGRITMRALGTTETLTSADSSASFLKFGNYMQARDPVTRDRMNLDKPLDDSDRRPFLNYFNGKRIARSVVTFRDVVYRRQID